MKSYFAKLADRATIGSPTAPINIRAKAPSHDFHDSLTEDLESPEHGLRLPRSSNRISTAQPSRSDEMPRRIEPAKTNEHDLSPPREAASEVSLATVPRQTLADSFRDVAKERLEADSLQRRPRVEPTDQDQLDSDDDSSDAEMLRLDLTRLLDVQHEHSGLLRRADQFMNELLDQREHSDQSSGRKVIEDDSPGTTRLQPNSLPSRTLDRPTRRMSEPDDSPSLVIGKLTVEVSSPTPQPPQSTRVVVVQRGESRSSATPSSRRFGLGQF